MEIHYTNGAMPYNSVGSFMDFFGGVTYDHVNYIFADPPYAQVVSSFAGIYHFFSVFMSCFPLLPFCSLISIFYPVMQDCAK